MIAMDPMRRRQVESRCGRTRSLLMVVLLVAAGCGSGGGTPAEQVVIRVNGEPLLRAELDRAVERVDRSFSVRDRGGEQGRGLRREVLRQLVQRRLLLQEARRRGLALSAEERRRVLVEERGEVPEADFTRMLEQAGLTAEEWEERVVEDRVIDRLVHEVVDGTLAVTDEEVQAYYRDHPDEFKAPERVVVRQIVVATRDEAKRVRRRIAEQGEDFGQVAREVSLSPDAERGGEIGPFGRGEMPPEFEEACFSLQIGEISPVVKSPYGYHIFRLEKRLPAGTVPLVRAREAIRRKILARKKESAFAAYQEKLWKEAKLDPPLDR